MVVDVAVIVVAVVAVAVLVVVADGSGVVDLGRDVSEPGAEFTNIRNWKELRYFKLVRFTTEYISAS